MLSQKKEKVVVALSGGIDSSVAALLLKEKKNYELYAVFMQNWDVELNEGTIRDEEGCSIKEDLKMVRNICEKLDIPLTVYNFVFEYWEYVFEPYLDKLRNNLISNPDIFCNSNIKFGVLLERIKNDFGKDVKIATGHWAKAIYREDKPYLAVCANSRKDQTYFLSRLSSDQLKSVIFPLEDIQDKEEIRRIARENGFPNWNKKESMGMCFIGKRKYIDFVGKYLDLSPGELVDIETGNVLGEHKGINLYALHQRSGLFLKGYEEKYYVCGKDVEKNVIYLCRESKIPEYLHNEISLCVDLHWINEAPLQGSEVFVKTRHSCKFLKSKISSIDSQSCLLKHDKVYVTSPGQYIVFYDLEKKICLGSGMYKGDGIK